jgi:Rrf2 family transcriptional regulator, iron-sulfur cluster assembly transcription factor
MVLSKSCNYALRATLYIARQSRDGYIPINEICDQLTLSFHFVTKILQRLTQTGLLLSFKGPKGGVKLGKAAQDISIREIIEAIEGPEIFSGCLLGLNMCSNNQPCPTHDEWAPLREKMTVLFEKTTLANLAKKFEHQELRLVDLE